MANRMTYQVVASRNVAKLARRLTLALVDAADQARMNQFAHELEQKACRLEAEAMPGGIRTGRRNSRILHYGAMPCIPPALLTLLIAERLARERFARLRSFPDKSVRDAAAKQWQEAAEAVRAYRAKHP